MTGLEKALGIVSHPNVAYILFLLGLVGLYFEMSSPGAVLPGIVGGIALLLALYAFSVLPVNFAGVALILFAVLLFVLEIKAASHGVLAAGGAIALLVGSLLLFSGRGESGYRVDLGIVLPAVTMTLAVLLFLTFRTIALRRAPGADRFREPGRAERASRPAPSRIRGAGDRAPGRGILGCLRRPRRRARRERAGRRRRRIEAPGRTEGVMQQVLSLPGCAFAVFILLLFVFKWINILKEYERAVTFWLGPALDASPRGPASC